LTRSLNLAAMADYGHSAGLQVISKTDFSTDTFLVGLQANRALTRTLSVYFSYNYQHQTSSGSTFGLAPINGQQQILSLGVTYSPSPVRLGR
jgi:long-subunit fatty acid transport protein